VEERKVTEIAIPDEYSRKHLAKLDEIVVIPGWNPPDRELELELEGES